MVINNVQHKPNKITSVSRILTVVPMVNKLAHARTTRYSRSIVDGSSNWNQAQSYFGGKMS